VVILSRIYAHAQIHVQKKSTLLSSPALQNETDFSSDGMEDSDTARFHPTPALLSLAEDPSAYSSSSTATATPPVHSFPNHPNQNRSSSSSFSPPPPPLSTRTIQVKSSAQLSPHAYNSNLSLPTQLTMENRIKIVKEQASDALHVILSVLISRERILYHFHYAQRICLFLDSSSYRELLMLMTLKLGFLSRGLQFKEGDSSTTALRQFISLVQQGNPNQSKLKEIAKILEEAWHWVDDETIPVPLEPKDVDIAFRDILVRNVLFIFSLFQSLLT